MALKDWNKKGEDWYETKEFPRGEVFAKKDEGGYVLYHKPANIGSICEPMKWFKTKDEAHEAVMHHIKTRNF